MRKLGMGIFWLAWLGLFLPAQASIVLKMSDQQLAQGATSIVHGKVVNKTSKWDKKHRRIYTFVTLSVLTMVKGKATQQEIVVRQLGGEASRYGMRVPGTARFSLGEEVLVFLQKKATLAQPMVMGMAWGKFRVMTDPRTKQRLIERNLNGLTLAVRTKSGRVQLLHKHKHAHTLKNSTHAHKRKVVLFQNYVQQLRAWIRTPAIQKPTLRPTPRLQK